MKSTSPAIKLGSFVQGTSQRTEEPISGILVELTESYASVIIEGGIKRIKLDPDISLVPEQQIWEPTKNFIESKLKELETTDVNILLTRLGLTQDEDNNWVYLGKLGNLIVINIRGGFEILTRHNTQDWTIIKCKRNELQKLRQEIIASKLAIK